MRERRDYPWPGPVRPKCPKCGRPVVYVPTPGGVLLCTLSAVVGGWTYVRHVCLHPAARYGAPAVREGPPLESERAEFPGLS